MKRKLPSFLLLVLLTNVRAQNLVPDSSFEWNAYIPTDFSAINASRSWTRPSGGTSDLFCTLTKAQKYKTDKAFSFVDVPQNAMGYQQAHSGTCYAGLFAQSHGDYREYLQTPLNKPLRKNVTYLFSMYVSLADYSRAYIDQLGVCLLPSKASFSMSDVITNLEPNYVKTGEFPGDDVADWHLLSFTYTAKGGEAYLLIGSFEFDAARETGFVAPKEMRSRINQNENRDAYYYIDDVSLLELAADSSAVEMLPEQELPDNEPVPGQVTVLKNVLFESDKDILLPSSYAEINALAIYLNENLHLRVVVSGHTDNSGNQTHNKTLSYARATRVAAHLRFRGVAETRIRCEGWGSTKPIADNASEVGRSINRRVEFVLLDP